MIFDDTSLLDDLSDKSARNSIELENQGNSIGLESRKRNSSVFKNQYFQKYQFMLKDNQDKTSLQNEQSFGDDDFGSIKVILISPEMSLNCL